MLSAFSTVFYWAFFGAAGGRRNYSKEERVIAKLLLKTDRTFKSTSVRLISAEGEQLGIVPVEKAFALAESASLDLVLVADKMEPPVCRVLDFGKLVYDSKKKQKDQKKHQHAQKLKEVKFHVNIDPHDYGIKIQHAIDFLKDGCKVRISLVFRGREAAHKEMGYELIEKLTGDLVPFGTAEGKATMAGKTISLSFNALAPH